MIETILKQNLIWKSTGNVVGKFLLLYFHFYRFLLNLKRWKKSIHCLALQRFNSVQLYTKGPNNILNITFRVLQSYTCFYWQLYQILKKLIKVWISKTSFDHLSALWKIKWQRVNVHIKLEWLDSLATRKMQKIIFFLLLWNGRKICEVTL